VYVDCVVKARDDPDSLFLSAVIESFGEGSKTLMREVWRDGTFGKFARMPLENVIPLDEPRLVKELGYSEGQLMQIAALMVPFGGLRDLKISLARQLLLVLRLGTTVLRACKLRLLLEPGLLHLRGARRNSRC
jgi:hypothetical protein